MSCRRILAYNALFRKLRQITKVAVGLITAFAIIGCGGGDTHSNFSQIRIAELQTAPADIEFGNVSVGGKSSQTLNLTNIGEAELTITQAQVTGTGFSISGPSLPLAIPAGGSVAINAVFSPKSSGDAKGSISFISNGINSPTTVSLSGTGLESMLSVSPASVDFGTVTVGNSAALAGSLANTGNTSLTVSEMSATGTGFSVSGPGLPLTLAAGQSTSFSVTFSPQAAGKVSGSVTITSNAANSPVVEALSGTGANPHSVSLSWKASSSADVIGYNLYRSSISGGPYTALNGLLVTGTAYTDTAVQAGQTYYYVTTAVNSSFVESAYSNEVEAIVPSP
jgi:hypothetical protein